MQSQNICKFINEPVHGQLTTKHFIFETCCPKGKHEMFSVTHSAILVTSGIGKYYFNKKEYTLEKGMLLFILPGFNYILQNIDKLEYMCIEYFGERTDELNSRFGITSSNFIFNYCKGLIPVWKESLIRANGINIDLLSESMLLYAFSQLQKSSSQFVDIIDAVTNYISEHYTDKNLSLSLMSDDLGYNSKYLSHLIMEKMNVGFSEYVKELRLKQAILLMQQGLTSVKNIAILCGFSDPLYFSKVFRQKFSISPKEYIKSQNLRIDK